MHIKMSVCLSKPKILHKCLMCALFDLPTSKGQNADVCNARTTKDTSPPLCKVKQDHVGSHVVE